MDLKWKDLPPSRAGRPKAKQETLGDKLRKRPGKWAVIENVSASMASIINSGRSGQFQPAGDFEARLRNSRNVEGYKSLRGDVYVRYVGQAEQQEQTQDNVVDLPTGNGPMIYGGKHVAS